VDAARAAAPDIAGRVDLHAIGRAATITLRLGPDAAARQRALGTDVEAANVLPLGFVDKQVTLVAPEAEPVPPRSPLAPLLVFSESEKPFCFLQKRQVPSLLLQSDE
jgi:hypothetical protein